MRTTLTGNVPAYIGADLTDRYSEGCRDIDVCGLTPVQEGLRASFWHWQWDRAPQPLEVKSVAAELRAARVALLDGPQALAQKGMTMRICERQSAAVGKTPERPPGLTKPFAGFIRSSIELFAALRSEGIVISPPGTLEGVSEVYPGHLWVLLNCGRTLPRKSTETGRLARKVILEALGVTNLPDLPSHDQNDAAVAAILAAISDNQVNGISATSIGKALSIDSDGTLREGPMVIPQLSAIAIDRIACALRQIQFTDVQVAPGVKAVSGLHRNRAEELLACLVRAAINGSPQVYTYGEAYRRLFNTYAKFSMAYARKVVALASTTCPCELPGLGLVRLDTFIVSKKDGVPSSGYWPSAHHDREEWERVLGNASID